MPNNQSQDQVDELVRLMPVILRRIKPDPNIVANCPSGTLAYSEMRILLHLAVNGDSGSGAIAEAIGMSRPGVTEAIDRLVAKEFVERAGHEGDRRRVNVRLTPQAVIFAERILARWRDGFTRSLSRLDSAEQVGFIKGMRALADSLLEISNEETMTRASALETPIEVLRS